MKAELTEKGIRFRIFRGEKMYVAESLDVGIVTQARTFEELKENLREAIALYLEGDDGTTV